MLLSLKLILFLLVHSENKYPSLLPAFIVITSPSAYLPISISSIFTEFKAQELFKNLVKTNSKDFHSLFVKIHNEYTLREKGFQNIIRAHLIELITKLFREIDKQQPSFTQSHRELVEKAIDHMRENYKSHISLDDIVSGDALGEIIEALVTEDQAQKLAELS